MATFLPKLLDILLDWLEGGLHLCLQCLSLVSRPLSVPLGSLEVAELRSKQSRGICHGTPDALCIIINVIECRYNRVNEFCSILLLQLSIKKWNLARPVSDTRGLWANQDVSTILL